MEDVLEDEEVRDTTTTAELDRVRLNRLDLPSGEGWVEFGDPYSLTGDQVQKLRKQAEASDKGDATNAVLTRCVALFVAAWDINYLAADAKLPRYDPKVLGKLRGIDLVAIERHIRPAMALYLDIPGAKRDDGNP